MNIPNDNLFSFKLDGNDAFDLAYTKSVSETHGVTTTVYRFGDLKITNIFKKYDRFDAVEWVNYF